jgi:galactose mutarotase-like enzyme
MSQPNCIVEQVTLDGDMRAVRLSNPFMRVEVLPDKGADIYSIVHRNTGVDVMWKSPLGLRPLDAGWSSPDSQAAWLEHYEGGWQELLPHTGAPETYKGVELSFHGESSLLPWQYEIVKDAGDEIEVVFSVRLFRSPFALQRRMVMNAASSCVRLIERVTNEAGEPMDFVWGHHPAYGAPFLSEHLRVQTNARVVFTDPAYDSDHCKVVPGELTEWPYAKGKDGSRVDLRGFASQTERNFFMGYLRDFDGPPWYALLNAHLKLGIGVAWSPDVFKHLWFWQEQRASTGFPFYGRTYTIALEPHTSYPHGLVNIMNTTKTHRTLGPGESLDAELTFAMFDYEGEQSVGRVKLDGQIVMT